MNVPARSEAWAVAGPRAGFTLVELLVSMAVLALVAVVTELAVRDATAGDLAQPAAVVGFVAGLSLAARRRWPLAVAGVTAVAAGGWGLLPPLLVALFQLAARGRGWAAAGVAALVGSALSNQLGAASGSLAFPAMGPLGVVAVRQLVAAVVLLPAVRPDLRAFSRGQWWPVLSWFSRRAL